MDLTIKKALATTLGSSAYENNAEFKPSKDARLIELIRDQDLAEIKILIGCWERGWETAWIKSKDTSHEE